MIGNGSFGVVYQAKLVETGEMVAIKKVLQDKRFKNRELQIMRRLEHCNIVKLMYFFYTSGEKKDEIYLGRTDSADPLKPVICRCFRELPDMISASEGEWGSWESGHSKGGGMNFTV